MQADRKFWIVWRSNGGVPVRTHATHLAAWAEAKRLAATNPGHTFIVLCAEKSISIAPCPQAIETVYK